VADPPRSGSEPLPCGLGRADAPRFARPPPRHPERSEAHRFGMTGCRARSGPRRPLRVGFSGQRPAHGRCRRHRANAALLLLALRARPGREPRSGSGPLLRSVRMTIVCVRRRRDCRVVGPGRYPAPVGYGIVERLKRLDRQRCHPWTDVPSQCCRMRQGCPFPHRHLSNVDIPVARSCGIGCASFSGGLPCGAFLSQRARGPEENVHGCENRTNIRPINGGPDDERGDGAH
jgi:hypothetical protein